VRPGGVKGEAMAEIRQVIWKNEKMCRAADAERRKEHRCNLYHVTRASRDVLQARLDIAAMKRAIAQLKHLEKGYEDSKILLKQWGNFSEQFPCPWERGLC
jgi:hypothetical protein